MAGFLAISFPGPASAADIPDRAGTAEFQFLENLVYARPAGLAGAYTSLAQGEDAVGYNPAGLSLLQPQRSVSGTFRYHYTDVSSGNVTYAFPGAAGIKYAVSAAYVNYGHIEELDEEGVASGADLLPASFNPALTASRAVSDRVRVGATLKGVTEYLGDFEGSQVGVGWGLDAGLLYDPGARNLGFGLSLLNLGTKLQSQLADGETGGLLPVSVKGGFYYHPLSMPRGRVAVDLELPWHDSPLLSGGFEYAITPALTARVGSRASFSELRHAFLLATDQRPGDFEGGNALKAAGGFTFQAEGIGVDYAAQYWHGLSWVHAVTLRYGVM
jgi:hypothetical protein